MKSLLLILVTFAVAASADANIVSASFDHKGEGDNTIRSLDEGDRLEITIDNTCPGQFEYAVHGLKKTPPAGGAAKGQAGEAKQLTPDEENALGYLKRLLCSEVKSQKLDTVYYDSTYGGYEVTAKRRPDAVGWVFVPTNGETLEQSIRPNGSLYSCFFPQITDADGKVTTNVETDKGEVDSCLQKKVAPSAAATNKDKPLYELADRRFLVRVVDSSWHYDFSGGVFLTKAINKRYAAVANTAGQYTIIRNSEGEDDYGTGIGMFITASPKSGLCLKNDICWAPLSLGLGASNQSDLNVFAGTSVKFGRHAFLTLGMNFAQIDTLPGNLRVGDTIADPNALTTLDKKRVGEFFVSFSYTFFGDGGAALQKRISPAGQ